MSAIRLLSIVSTVLVAGVAFAGGLAAPIMEEVVILEDTATSSSSAGLIIPLILIALVALALSKTTPAAATIGGGTLSGLLGDDILDTGVETQVA